MSVDSLPTDNLYKFVTLLGILLFAFCTWALDDSMRRIDANDARDALMMEEYQSRSDALLDRAQSFVDILQLDPNRSNAPELHKKLDEIMSDITKLRERYVPVAADMASRKADLQSFGRNYQYWVYGRYVGMVMTSLGFVLWYLLHQRFQDQLLRTEASASQKKIRHNVTN